MTRRLAHRHGRRAPPARALAAAGALAWALSWASPAAAAPDCPPPTAVESAQAGAPGAHDRGMLWRLRKGAVTSYLYGSIHVGRAHWMAPGPQVRAALLASDTLALEIDLADPAMQRRVIAAQSDASAASAATPLPPALAARLARQIEAACVGPDALAPLHPVMQAVVLTLLSARRDGLDPAFAQELALGQFARGAGIPVVSLETPESQIGLLLPEQPAQTPQRLAQALDPLESGAARRTMRRLAEGWALGRLDDLANYAQWCECVADADDRALLRRANDDRNPVLAARIDALHQQGRRVFAAVGALHMTGDQALPRLMQQRGYRVERLRFTGRPPG